MILEEGLTTYLLTVEALTAMVNDQVYAVMRPQGARPLPEVLITRTATRRQKLFCGTNSLAAADMQIDCYAVDGASCVDLAKVVRNTLVDFTGTMGEVYVDQVTLENEFVLVDGDPGYIRMVQLYNFWYVED